MGSIRSSWRYILVSLPLLLSSCSSSHTYDQARQSFAAQDYQTAFTEVQPAAEQGDARAQYALGYMYYYGKGTDVNKELGQKWIARSAAQGYEPALNAYESIISQQQTVGNITPNSPNSIPAPTPTMQPAAAAAPTPTPTPAPVPSILTVPQQIQQTPSTHYAVQLSVQSSAHDAETFIKSNGLSSKAKYFQRNVNGHVDYVIFMGNYSTRAAAQNAAKNLPHHLRENHPWVRSYAELQAQLNSSSITEK